MKIRMPADNEGFGVMQGTAQRKKRKIQMFSGSNF